MNRQDILNMRLHRGNKNYQKSEFCKRLLWSVAKNFLRIVPRFLYETRNVVLRLLGAKIGKRVRIYPSAEIFFPWNIELGDEVTVGPKVQLYSLGKITIGDGTLISQGSHLCAGTHDYNKRNLPLQTPGIKLGEGVWVCADAFLGPGISVGDFSIVGARAVVVKSFPELSIIGGNPARLLRKRPVPSQ